MNRDIHQLEMKIGYEFKNKDLILAALTHPSYASAHDYERLEFLGDAVIELCISEYLYREYPDAEEGALTKKRSKIVCSHALFGVAQRIEIGSYMRLGKGEEMTDGRNKKSILENAVEAMVGAVYLDADLLSVNKVIERLLLQHTSFERIDYKSSLQEYIQKKNQYCIRYETVRTEGPAHNTVFYVQLFADNNPVSEGCGKNKKEAEQNAAKNALQILK